MVVAVLYFKLGGCKVATPGMFFNCYVLNPWKRNEIEIALNISRSFKSQIRQQFQTKIVKCNEIIKLHKRLLEETSNDEAILIKYEIDTFLNEAGA